MAAAPGGIQHRFLWDAEADLGGEQPTVHVRVRCAANDGIGLTSETTIDISVGFPGGAALFSGLTDVAAGTAPLALVAADLDRNGTIDLAVVANGEDAVRILLGLGDGRFTNGDTIAVGNSPQSVAVGDINNDDIPDLVVSNFDDDTVSLLIGDGDGGFTSSGTVTTGDQPAGVLLADFDTDGSLDLAVVNGNGGSVDVRLGAAPAASGRPTPLPLPHPPGNWWPGTSTMTATLIWPCRPRAPAAA